MPLLDHFHQPICPVHDWEAFHGRWAFTLALRGAFFVPVDLEATYTETRQRCRL